MDNWYCRITYTQKTTHDKWLVQYYLSMAWSPLRFYDVALARTSCRQRESRTARASLCLRTLDVATSSRPVTCTGMLPLVYRVGGSLRVLWLPQENQREYCNDCYIFMTDVLFQFCHDIICIDVSKTHIPSCFYFHVFEHKEAKRLVWVARSSNPTRWAPPYFWLLLTLHTHHEFPISFLDMGDVSTPLGVGKDQLQTEGVSHSKGLPLPQQSEIGGGLNELGCWI
jgi:hypothetical protein